MQKLASFLAHDNYVLALKFASADKTLISGGMDSVIKLWSLPDCSLAMTVKGHANSVHTMSMTQDETLLATGSTDCRVKLWSFPDMELKVTVQDRRKTVADVSFSADGQWVAAASYGGRVAIWTREGEPALSFAPSKKNLVSAKFSPDGKLLAAAGLGDEITIYSLPEGEKVATLEGHKIAVGSLHFIENGRTLLSMGYEKTIRLWDTETWECKAVHYLNTETQTRAVILSPDESHAAVSMESLVQLWQVDPWQHLAEIPVGTKSVSSMAYSTDGRQIAIGGADKRIRIWSLE